MAKTLVATTAALAFAGVAQAGPAGGELTADRVTELKKAWGEGIVKIGKVHTDGGDVKAAAKAHIEKFYAYGQEKVLFKPTLASADQFRGTFDEAMSYFIGGINPEDGG
ncbi:MAG: phosphoribosyl-AMP cyclohydrolase, partial [Pseudomonadota bacterium]